MVLVKVLVVNLAVNHPRSSPSASPLTLIEVAQVGIVTETADEVEAVLAYAIAECAVGEECVSHYEM